MNFRRIVWHTHFSRQQQYTAAVWRLSFSEEKVEARGLFKSHFMIDFLAGQLPFATVEDDGIFSNEKAKFTPLTKSQKVILQAKKFSKEAEQVFACGKKLW